MGESAKHIASWAIQGIRSNDSRVLSQLYRTVYPKVRAHVLNNSGLEEQAKDIFQEAFIACWRNVKEGKVNSDSNMEAYLFTVARNKWTDHLRSAYTRNRVSTDSLAPLQLSEEQPGDPSIADPRLERMRVAFGKLGDTCKQLLTLFYFERKSMNEISETVGIAPASARNQKYRCMEKLRVQTLESPNHG